jgi:hypothetical protein
MQGSTERYVPGAPDGSAPRTYTSVGAPSATLSTTVATVATVTATGSTVEARYDLAEVTKPPERQTWKPGGAPCAHPKKKRWE